MTTSSDTGTCIFGLLWCSIVLVMDLLGVTAALDQGFASATFVETTATIVESRIEERPRPKSGSPLHVPFVRYRFTVGGRELESTCLRRDEFQFDDSQAEAVVGRYPVGRRVSVYYRSTNPADSILERGPHMGYLTALLVAAPFNAVAFGFLFSGGAYVRSHFLGRPVVGVRVMQDGHATVVRTYERSPIMSAVTVGGGASFLGLFVIAVGGVLAGTTAPILTVVFTLVLVASFAAWYRARRCYIEFCLDPVRREVVVLRPGSEVVVSCDDFRKIEWRLWSYSPPPGNPREYVWYTLSLPAKTKAGAQIRFPLPIQTSERNAAFFAAWLGGLLRCRLSKIPA